MYQNMRVIDSYVDLTWCRLPIIEVVKVKERIVLGEIHLSTTRRHSSMGSHTVICHPTEVTEAFTPTGQVCTRFIDPVMMKG